MKYLAYALITFGLIVGSLTAVTAYVPRLDGAGGLTLNAEAGRSPDDETVPLVAPAEAEAPIVLTDTLAAALAASGTQRVRVKEFAFGRWDHGWLFLLGLGAMLAGGLILRREERQRMAVLLNREAAVHETPGYALDEAHREVTALLDEVRTLDEAAQIGLLTTRIEALQLTHLAAFVEARPELIGRYGIAGYARIMDVFAAGERRINRAWSAAADGVLPEALDSLAGSLALLEEARARLDAGGAAAR